MKIKINIRTSYLIHLFAFLHVIVATGCLWAGMDDELLLTVLTMTLTVIICIKHNLSFETSATFMILVNIISYLIGTGGGQLLAQSISSPYLSSGIATTLTTEIVGWLTLLAATIFQKDDQKNHRLSSQKRINWISSAVVVIFIMRFIYAGLLNTSIFSHGLILEVIRTILSDSGVMITTICMNIIFIGYSRRYRKRFKNSIQILAVGLFVLCVTAAGALMVRNEVSGEANSLQNCGYFQAFATMFLVEMTILCVIYLIISVVWSRQQVTLERERADWEKYRYLRLKQQVNPHFLFNSLNILDCLVCEEKTEQASIYIHKLSSIYRYFLRNEDNPTSSLSDELEFSNQYLDLMKVRFQEGFQVQQNIPEHLLQRRVIPCSLQMLLENAFKHNTVQEDQPLILRISADDDHICVSNDIRPKCKTSPSTHLGQQYIKQQYQDIAGKDVLIENDGSTYTVKLPLL